MTRNNDVSEIKGVTFSIPLTTKNTEKNVRVALYIEQLSGQTTYDFWLKGIKINTAQSAIDTTIPTAPAILLQNYPNPFNPITTIKFKIENSELRINTPLYFVEGKCEGFKQVQINIYNIKGQKVRSLVNGFYPIGEHNVVWNGLDDSGVGVSGGIYLYRITTGDFSETKKMVLIK